MQTCLISEDAKEIYSEAMMSHNFERLSWVIADRVKSSGFFEGKEADLRLQKLLQREDRINMIRVTRFKETDTYRFLNHDWSERLFKLVDFNSCFHLHTPELDIVFRDIVD
jgi:hypothetical protein